MHACIAMWFSLRHGLQLNQMLYLNKTGPVTTAGIFNQRGGLWTEVCDVSTQDMNVICLHGVVYGSEQCDWNLKQATEVVAVTSELTDIHLHRQIDGQTGQAVYFQGYKIKCRYSIKSEGGAKRWWQQHLLQHLKHLKTVTFSLPSTINNRQAKMSQNVVFFKYNKYSLKLYHNYYAMLSCFTIYFKQTRSMWKLWFKKRELLKVEKILELG